MESDSVAETCSALQASSLQHFSAIGGGHSLAEAVLLRSLSLLGLISSLHALHLLSVVESKR